MNLLNVNFNIAIEKIFSFNRRRRKEEENSFEILKDNVEEHPFDLDIISTFIFIIDEDLKFLYTSSYPPFLKKRYVHYEYITNIFPPKITSFYVKLILRKEVRAQRKVLAKINGKYYLVIVKPFLEPPKSSSTIIIHVPFTNISNLLDETH